MTPLLSSAAGPNLPRTTDDLSGVERSFLQDMHDLGFGRFESLRVVRGQLESTSARRVQAFKFGAKRDVPLAPARFELKSQQADFFASIRAIDRAEIRSLDVRDGLPCSMEIERQTGAK